MSKVADYYITQIEGLAQETGYTFDFLFDKWDEMQSEGEFDFERFAGVTRERNW